MRRILTVLAGIFVLASWPVVGQTPQAPVFRSTVTLVPVDVSVLDGNGKPVPGLTADDFEVKLDGKVQPVRTVAYEQAETPTAPSGVTAGPPRETSNATPAPDPRLFVVLVDDLFIPATRDKGLFLGAGRFVADLPATDVVGFTTTSGAATVNPTRDRGAVIAGLRRLAGQFSDPRDLPPDVAVGLDEAVEIASGDTSLLKEVVARDCTSQFALLGDYSATCPADVEQKARHVAAFAQDTTERQLLSYLGVINAMREAPGQRCLVLLTDGLLVSHRGRDQATILEPVARAAAAAGVQLSVLFADPDVVNVTSRNTSESQMRRADGQALMQGIQTVSDLTGGNFYRVMGQPDRFFGFVVDATSGIYHLGVEAPTGAKTSKDFVLAARVKRSGLTAHANRVAVLPVASPAVPVATQLQMAVTKGVPNYGVPLTVATVVRRADTGPGLNVGANVEIPGTVPGPLTLMFGLLDATGKLQTGRKTVDVPVGGGNYRVSLSLPVAPGKYRLRFSVADAAGQVGSLDAPVTAQLGHVGPFLVSDVMTAWTASDGKPQFLALEAVPAAATTLGAFLELYPANPGSPPADVQVQWTLVGDGVQPVASQTVVAARAADRLSAIGQFPLATLAPGVYEIRATVLAAGQVVGTVSTTIRKAEKGGGWSSVAAVTPQH